MNLLEEKSLFEKIKQSDVKAFEQLFHHYYKYLGAFATRILEDDEAAEEIVQDFFVKLWDKRTQITVDSSVKNYFFRSVKNLCLNYIKHQQIKLQHAQYVISEAEHKDFADNFIEVNLEKEIEKSIQSLPEKRREIFLLSREEGLKYREIAEKLNISIKTVEVQMGLAIKTLREKLKKYRTFLFFLCVLNAKRIGVK